MKARDFFLRTEFIKWLEQENKLTVGGVSSYVSNLASLFANYSNQLLAEAQFAALIDEGNLVEIQDVLDSMFTIVNLEKHNENSILPKAKLSDIGSALRKYESFLCEYAIALGKASEDIVSELDIEIAKSQFPILPLINIKKIHLEVADIRTKFTNRLISQDRPYGNVYFPISIIKKLFYKNEHRKDFIKWNNEQLDKIKFHTTEKTLTLKDIKSLKIDSDGSVILTCNDGKTTFLFKIKSTQSVIYNRYD